MICWIKSLEENPSIRLSVVLLSLFSFLNGAEPADTNYDEAEVPEYRLPKLLKSDLRGAEFVKNWHEKRRPELQALLDFMLNWVTGMSDFGSR